MKTDVLGSCIQYLSILRLVETSASHLKVLL